MGGRPSHRASTNQNRLSCFALESTLRPISGVASGTGDSSIVDRARNEVRLLGGGWNDGFFCSCSAVLFFVFFCCCLFIFFCFLVVEKRVAFVESKRNEFAGSTKVRNPGRGELLF